MFPRRGRGSTEKEKRRVLRREEVEGREDEGRVEGIKGKSRGRGEMEGKLSSQTRGK